MDVWSVEFRNQDRRDQTSIRRPLCGVRADVFKFQRTLAGGRAERTGAASNVVPLADLNVGQRACECAAAADGEVVSAGR